MEQLLRKEERTLALEVCKQRLEGLTVCVCVWRVEHGTGDKATKSFQH